MKQVKNFKFQLRPTSNQERELSIQLETHRRLYNEMLRMRIDVWEQNQTSLSNNFQSKCFKVMRRFNPKYAKINFTSAQRTLKRLHNSYGAFFRRIKAGEKAGFPRFKGQDRFRSFTFTYGQRRYDGVKLTDNLLYIQHVGMIRVNLHRPIEGKIKTVTLLREAGKWYAIFACEQEVAVKPSTKPAVGLDMGLEHFVTTSNGEHFPNPRFLKRQLRKIRRECRVVSRRTKGSLGRRRAANKLRKSYAKIKNQRRDHAHKTALTITRRYGTVVLERLNIKSMLKNRKLARSISDAGWYGFQEILRSKAENAGVRVISVDPSYTSQQCYACGWIAAKPLSCRIHKCDCGWEVQRDHNAAKNILARGLARTEPTRRNVSSRKHVSRSLVRG